MNLDAYTGKSKPCPGGYRIPVKWNCKGSVESSRKEQVQTRLVGAINKEVDKFAKSDERRTRIAFHTKDGDRIADFQLKKNSRMLNGKKVDTIEIPIIDFHEKLRGFGTADAILEHIQKKFPDRAVYIEMVQHRWAKSLADKGWETQLNPEDSHERNLYRMPLNTRKDAASKTAAKAKMKKVFDEFKAGELNIGKSDKKVKSHKQAIAIALSKAGKSRKDAKQPPLGSGGRWDKLIAKLKGEGYSDEAAARIAASIGRKKYGSKKFSSLGRKDSMTRILERYSSAKTAHSKK